jgi:hypothetical protein
MTDAHPPAPENTIGSAAPRPLGFFRRLFQELNRRPLEAVAALTTSFGFVLGVAGLGFVWWQIHEVHEQLDDAAYSHVYDWVRSIDEVFIEHPQYRKYFYDRVRLPNSTVPDDILAVAEYKLDFVDYFFSQIEHLDRDKYEYDTWKAYVEDSFRSSPILCKLLKDEQEWYGYEIRYMANPICPGVAFPAKPVDNPVFWKYFKR